jgi:hypothetical protein
VSCGTRRSLLLALTLALAACSDRDAPRPVNDLGSPPPAVASRPVAAPPVAASADPNDPAEPGIPDLARLARYVFRTMQRHEDVCAVENPYRDSLHFAFAIDVTRGRMARVGLAEVAFEGSGGRRVLPKVVWPRELGAYVACLAPHLKAVEMSPAPADGSYQPFYSFAGQPDGITAP